MSAQSWAVSYLTRSSSFSVFAVVSTDRILSSTIHLRFADAEMPKACLPCEILSSRQCGHTWTRDSRTLATMDHGWHRLGLTTIGESPTPGY